MLARTSNAHRSAVLFGLTSLLLIGLASIAHADTPSYSVTGWDIEPANGAYTLGYTFVPTQNIAVTALGEWVTFGQPINGTEMMGIFDNNNQLLFSSTWNQANATMTSNTMPNGSQFRYVDITSIPLSGRTLLANQTYTYAATILNNDIATGSQNQTAGAGITITSDGLYSIGDTVSGPNPSAPSGSVGYNMYGVNFEYTSASGVAATPEPGTWALLAGLTTGGLSLLRRRRKTA